MGGQGTWYIVYRNPKRFAAIAPICGGISPDFWTKWGCGHVVPADSGETFSAFARQLRQIPTWIFHGEVDPVVPVEESRKTFAALKAAGAPVQYSEVPGSFASTNLDFVLRSRGITNIALGGFLTNCCVESTMRTGYEKGYNVVTLKDCTAALSEEEQKAAVEKNYPMFSRPMDHNEFIAELGGKETTAGASTGRGYTTDAGQPQMEATP